MGEGKALGAGREGPRRGAVEGPRCAVFRVQWHHVFGFRSQPQGLTPPAGLQVQEAIWSCAESPAREKQGGHEDSGGGGAGPQAPWRPRWAPEIETL